MLISKSNLGRLVIYGARSTYELTNTNLKQSCGHTTFQKNLGHQGKGSLEANRPQLDRIDCRVYRAQKSS